MLSDQAVSIIQALLVFAGGVITTYLTVVYKNRRNTKRIPTAEDRLAFAFNRYEQMVKEVDSDLAVARQINREQSDQIEKMQVTIDTLREELHKAQAENRELQIANIKLMGKSYVEVMDKTGG